MNRSDVDVFRSSTVIPDFFTPS